ncbi:MAG: cadherin domain-containing protein [Nitrospiraceae bacterium]
MFNSFKKKKETAPRPQKAQHHSPASSGVKQSLLSLEQRLMFDAAASATASEVASEQVAQEQAEAAVSSDNHADGPSAEQTESQGLLDAIATYNPGESRSEVVFVDPTVPNYQEMLAGMAPHIEVIMLDGGQDGVEQMAEALSGRSGIDAIHLISHGSSGELQLGTGTLNAQSMSGEYASELATIRESLSDHADVLVYGCNFAEGSEGVDAVNLLAELTGADVAASTDQTGHIDLGGDWEFEVQAGSIETDLALTDSTQVNWAGILGTETVKDTFSTESYSNNNGTQSWSSSWTETDASGGGASGGDVRVNSSQLRIDTDTVGNAISREVNLSSATGAKLTFDYANTLTGEDRIEARVSSDGGKTYQTLSGGVFSGKLNAGSGTASIDLSGYMSANTRIQFIVTGTGGGDRLYVDNVQVSYETGPTNSAPTITSNSGGATASITVAENTTTVTTVTATDANAGQTLTYSISGGADASKFTINSSTGALSFASAPNYESPTDSGGNNVYDVTVQVSDGNGGTDTQAIAVTVANANEAPTDIVQSAGTGINLNTDGGNNSYLYTTNGGSILGGRTAFSIEAQFSSSIAPVSGEHKVLVSYATTGADNEVRVGIAQTSSSTCQLTLTINGSRVNLSGYDASRLFDGGQHQLGVTWSATNGGYNFYVDGQQVGAGTDLQTGYTTRSTGTLVVGMDQDSVGGGFQTNQVFKGTVQDVRVFNDVRTAAEISTYLNQDVPTSESGLVADWTMNNLSGGSTSDVVAGRNLTVGSVSGSGWVASTPLLTWKIAENVSTGTVVGTVTGTDPDAGDTKTYSLTDTAGGRFAMNASTGQLTVADGSLLNYESASSHTVTVRVTDSGGQSYNESFTINLTNMNEGPTGTDATLTLTEDTSHALTAANFGFSDVDAGDSLSAVRIDSLPTAGSLTLSGVAVTAGQVVSAADITAGRLAFTPAANANGTGYASVTFSVRDSNNVYDAAPNTMTFNVTAVNDAPVITPIAPNVTFVEGELAQVIDATGTIVDVDSTNLDGGVLTISISANGTAGDRLMVGNWGTGPGQVGVSSSNVTYGGTVIGTVSGGTSGSDPLTVTFNTSATSVAVQEVYRSIQFTNESDNPSTATRTLAIGLTDGDGGTATPQTKLVFVQATNDAPSDLFLSANTVAENATTGTAVGTVSGTDPDASDTKTYSLTDTAGGRFAIDSTTGQLTVADGSLLNYENATSHTVTVQVTDSGGQSHTEQFTINLTNVNEGPTGADVAVTLSEDTAHTLTTANFGFSDVDAGDTLSAVRIDTLPTAGTLTLSGVAVTAGQVVTAADITAGRLVFSPVADANGTGYASLTFSVQDSHSTSDAAPNTLTFNVTAVNDAPTDLALSANSVAENATTGTVVGTVTGTDPDASDTKTYSLNDTAGGRFAINASTGVITVADGSLLNYESAASHTLTVQVTDSGGQSYNESFTINLTNMNEGPTDLALSANSVAEKATTGTVVGTVSSTDPDASDTKTYSLTDTAGGRFAINPTTGVITVADGSLLNYENAASHSLTVQVTDSGGQSYNETFNLNLTNVNEAHAGTESTDALIEDMAHTLATTTFGPHDTYKAPKTSASDPHVANDLEESGFPLANTFQNMRKIATETPSTEIILTAERRHLSATSEERIGNGVNSKEPQQTSTQNEKRGSDVPADQTGVHRSATAEAERKDFLEPDDAIDPLENADTSTILKQTATMVLASVVLQNGLGNNKKLRRLLSHPAGASNVSHNPTPQQSVDDNRASDQKGSEHSRSSAEDADQAAP